jgi:hypothetical protein
MNPRTRHKRAILRDRRIDNHLRARYRNGPAFNDSPYSATVTADAFDRFRIQAGHDPFSFLDPLGIEDRDPEERPTIQPLTGFEAYLLAKYAPQSTEAMTEPVNNLGATEAQWRDWIDRSAAWEAANPIRRHKPHEVCDCPDIPTTPTRVRRGHCAAVGPIVPWQPRTEAGQ